MVWGGGVMYSNPPLLSSHPFEFLKDASRESCYAGNMFTVNIQLARSYFVYINVTLSQRLLIHAERPSHEADPL